MASAKPDLIYTLPFPISVNTYYRVHMNRVLLSQAGRKYKLDVQAALLEQGVRRVEGRLRVSLLLRRTDKRIFDIDNFQKSCLDSVKGILFEDDSQIDILHVKRGPVFKGGKAILKVWRLS